MGDAKTRGDDANEMGDNLTVVDLGTDFTPQLVKTGNYHTAFISTIGTVKICGRGAEGQLGYGNTENIGDESGEMGDNLDTVDLGTGFNATGFMNGGTQSLWNCVYDGNVPDLGALKCFGENGL